MVAVMANLDHPGDRAGASGSAHIRTFSLQLCSAGIYCHGIRSRAVAGDGTPAGTLRWRLIALSRGGLVLTAAAA